MTTVKTLMQSDILACPPATSLAEAARRMRERGCSSVLVEDEGRYVGIWTEQDALKVDFSNPLAFGTAIAQVMSAPVLAINWNASVSDLASRFIADGIRHLLVRDDQSHPVGIISQTDIVYSQGVDRLLRMRDVRSALGGLPLILDQAVALADAAHRMAAEYCDAAMVRYDDRTYGIVTGRDMVRFVMEGRSNALIGDLATRPLATVAAGTCLLQARDILAERGIRHLGVVDDDGEAVGIVTFATILASLHTMLLEFAKQASDQAEKTKQLFLAKISHELRTPLQAILGFAEFGAMQVHTIPSAKTEEMFLDIHEGGMRLLNLINDLLDMSKIEAGQMTYAMERENLADIARAVIHELSPLFAKKRQSLDLLVQEGGVTVAVDRDRIAQVLRNLLSNAHKFTPEEREISLSLGTTTDGMAKAVVSDQGCGLLEDELDRVFDTFVQSKRTRAHQGTGLGLAISREIVVAHGGTIWAANKPQGGTDFILTLPLCQAAE